MDGWIQLIQQVLLIIISGLVPVFVGIVVAQMRKRGLLDAMREKRVLVKKGVEFAEQAYYDLNGPQQYEKALAWIEDTLKQAGIPYTKRELRGLIDAAVFEMKEAWVIAYEHDE